MVKTRQYDTIDIRSPRELSGYFPGAFWLFPRRFVAIFQNLCGYSPGAVWLFPSRHVNISL